MELTWLRVGAMSNTRTTAMVDVETGQVHQLRPLKRPRGGRPARPRPNKGFMQLWGDALMDCHVSGAQLEVLLTLAGRMDRETGRVTYFAHEIVEHVGVGTTDAVYRMIRQLEERRAIIRDRRYRGTVIVNPNVFWRGTQEDREVALFEWENLTRG